MILVAGEICHVWFECSRTGSIEHQSSMDCLNSAKVDATVAFDGHHFVSDFGSSPLPGVVQKKVLYVQLQSDGGQTVTQHRAR